MNVIASDHHAAQLWRSLMGCLRQRIGDTGAHPARTVVLLPYAQLMPLARQFWAEQAGDGFAPRFETTMNWAAARAFVPSPHDLSFDIGRDLLTARAWLERAGLSDHAELLAGRLVDAAWEAAAAARAVPAGARAAWGNRVRGLLAAGLEAPELALEAALARVALDWAVASSYSSDFLLDPARAGEIDLLVVLQGLQSEPLSCSLRELFGRRAVAWPLAAQSGPGRIAWHQCLDASDEAERSAACVIRHLQAGRTPVALAATDRLLTRRIAALLAARGVAVRDETGWKLSTTRAAAHVMGSLRACAWDAATDEVLDWLKNVPALASGTVSALERRARRAGLREWRHLQEADWGEAPALVRAAREIAIWRESMQRGRPLAQWLAAARELLLGTGQWARLQRDAAGERVAQALCLSEGLETEFDQLPQANRRLELRDFTAWANDVLEAVSFVPTHTGDESVVILPFGQLLGRTFPALVLPGCDERTLPAAPDPSAAWTSGQRQALGLPSREALEDAQRSAWRYALQTPQCDVLWRASDSSGEPLLPSPLVQAARMQRKDELAADPRESRRLEAQPVVQPLPAAPALTPSVLSASSYEDLRRCPYRFFGLRMLGLREAEEIDTDLDKRDFGTWLHAVLRSFHECLRDRPDLDAPARARLLDETAREVTASHRLAEGEFLPFAAAWPAVREGYLAWLATHEAEGASFIEAESEHEMPLGTLKLTGRIDRIDRFSNGTMMVIDYKTEGHETTRERVRPPLEDTQLAFYAALAGHEPLRAAYVNVGERGLTRKVEHDRVEETRDHLLVGLQDDLRRLAEGHGMPPLGEGRACEFCTVRGLCRKDFWA